MVHAGQLALHVFGGLVRDVEVSAAVLGAAALANFRVDGTGNHVARGKLHPLRVVALHETLAGFVAKNASFTAHRFGDENSLHAGRPNHSRGMELHKLHVHQLGARFISHRHAVAGVFPGIRSDGPGFADAAGRDDHGLGLEHDEPAVFAPIGERAGDAIPVFEQARDRAFHVDVEAHLNAAILERSNHLEARSVAYMTQPLVSMPAKSALEDLAFVGAIEKSAPLLEFTDAVGSFLRVELSHAPVVEHFAAAHGVAEMRAPIVGRVNIGHGRRNAAFGHHRVRFAEQ